MSHLRQTALLEACRTLFGSQLCLSNDFLDSLQPSGVRSAFRNQAKAHHPDRHVGSSAQVRSQQAERFREIRQAYELIIDDLKRRHDKRANPRRPLPKTQPPRRPPQSQRSCSFSTRSGLRPTPLSVPSVPSIPLEFGMYGYYLGKLSYPQLIEALVWQRRQRPTLGAIALRWGWLSELRIARIVEHRGQAMRFGRKAVELGYLQGHQVKALLRHQRSLQQRIGQYFVEQGYLTAAEVEQISSGLERHNARIVRRSRSRQP
jgi:hypothetical protein